MNKAVIDMGTNTFKLLVGQLTEGKLEVTYQEDVFVRLGRGGISQNSITDDAINRAIDALNYFTEKVQQWNVKEVYAVGTSALRSATNKTEVLNTIEQKTGILPDVINGDKEAEYVYEGVKSDIQIGNDNALILDIGGGSIEFILCNHNHIIWKQSFEVGAQRLCDLFIKEEDPLSTKTIQSINHYLAEHLQPLKDILSTYPIHTLVGPAGSFDSLRQIHLHKYHSDQAICGYEIPFKDFSEIHNMFITFPREERFKIKGLISKRVDMIVPVSCAIDYIFQISQAKKIKVSSHSLREGVLVSKY